MQSQTEMTPMATTKKQQSHLRDLKWSYLQYELQTGIYMLESWEKATFNITVLLLLALFSYSSWIYMFSKLF